MIWSFVFWFVVGIPFLWSLFLVDNPKITRLKKIDLEITRGLNILQVQIRSFVKDKDQLPMNIEEITVHRGYANVDGYTKNLRQNHQIIYQKLDENKYQLCANFQRDNQKDSENIEKESYLVSKWLHGSGQTCFEFTKKVQESISS